MPNLIDIEYAKTGESTSTNSMGMRDMQENAFNSRDAQYILIKSPPASGKSRALMFVALDKLINQGINKVIVAVPERTIGSSFKQTDLKSYGFFENWNPSDNSNLCLPGNDGSKSKVNALAVVSKIDAGGVYCSQDITLQGSLQDIWFAISETTFELIKYCIDNPNIHPVPQNAFIKSNCRRKTTEICIDDIVDVHQFYNYIRMLDADDYENSFIKVGDFKLQLSRAKLCSDDSILADIKISKVKE